MSTILAFRAELRVSEALCDASVASRQVAALPAGWFRSKRDAWLNAVDRLMRLSNECQKKAGDIQRMVENNY